MLGAGGGGEMRDRKTQRREPLRKELKKLSFYAFKCSSGFFENKVFILMVSFSLLLKSLAAHLVSVFLNGG